MPGRKFLFVLAFAMLAVAPVALVVVEQPVDETAHDAGLTLEKAVAKYARPVKDVHGHTRLAGGSASYEFGNLICKGGRWSACLHVRNVSTCEASMCSKLGLPKTIGCHYLSATGAPNGRAALNLSIHEYAARRGMRTSMLSPSTLVFHLRLGDGSLALAVNRGGGGNSQFFPKRYESPSQFADVLSKIPRGVTNVILTGSLNAGGKGDLPGYLNASIGHITRVTAMLEARGYHVQQRVNGVSPSQVDEDIVYMTRAMHFMCSGGSFSLTISRMVAYRGGMVYPRKACLRIPSC